MPEQSGDKTQDATPHRRQEAVQQGQVARSQDLTSSLLLIAGLTGLLWLGGSAAAFFGAYMHRQLGGEAWLSIDLDFISGHGAGLLQETAKIVLPLMGLLFVVAALASVSQTGLLFLPEKLLPNIGHLDPLKGLTRMFSIASAVRLGLGLFKVGVVVAVAYSAIAPQWERICGLAELSVGQLALFLPELLLWTSLKIAGALFLLALLDYGYQWWQNEQDMKMTNQEVRDEMKDLQGDPAMIARRRSTQRQLAMNRLSTAVPKGDVTITNPTELAITIQYDAETMKAPVVVAKGAGIVAQRIRRLSLEHGIPIVEKKPLARALYKEVEIGKPIPAQLYSAVAEVLAYVYQLKGKKAM